MARHLNEGELVYVPRVRLGLDANGPSALVECKVASLQNRSARLTLPSGEITQLVAVSAVHRSAGIQVLKVGDFDTETTLLDPLAKSLLQYFRILLPDNMVLAHEVRSLIEFERYWQAEHALISHVVLIGHGGADSILFGVDGAVAPGPIVEALEVPGVEPKVLVSLCCQTGYASFGKHVSASRACSAFIGPFQSVHGAVSSQFCQTFFAYHFLQGETIRVAFKHATASVPGSTVFRLWEKAALTGGAPV